MMSDEGLNDLDTINQWRSHVAMFLGRINTSMTLQEIEMNVQRPIGVHSSASLEVVLKNDPFDRFSFSGPDGAARIRRVYRLDDPEIQDAVLEWRETLAELLSNGGVAVSLSELSSLVARPAGVPSSVKLIEVLKSDPANRFILANDDVGGIKIQYNYANLTSEQITSLKDQWRENVSRFLSNYSTSLSIQDISTYVSRPPYLDESITLYDILKSDQNGCFAISGELPNIRVRRVYRVDDPAIAQFVEDWRTAVANFLASQSVSVSLSDIGSSIARPSNLPASVKLIDVLRADSQQRFVLTGDGNSVRAALSTSARQKFASLSLPPAPSHPHGVSGHPGFFNGNASAHVGGGGMPYDPNFSHVPEFRLRQNGNGYNPEFIARQQADRRMNGMNNNMGRPYPPGNHNGMAYNNDAHHHYHSGHTSPALPVPNNSYAASSGMPVMRQSSPFNFQPPQPPTPPPPPLSRPPSTYLANNYAEPPRANSGALSRHGTEGSLMEFTEEINKQPLKKSSPNLGPVAVGSSSLGRMDQPPGIPLSALPSRLSTPSPSLEMKEWMVDASTPASYICPISKQVMREPVVCANGCTYDKTSLESYIRSKSLSPTSLSHLKIDHYNDGLKNLIGRYIETRSSSNRQAKYDGSSLSTNGGEYFGQGTSPRSICQGMSNYNMFPSSASATSSQQAKTTSHAAAVDNDITAGFNNMSLMSFCDDLTTPPASISSRSDGLSSLGRSAFSDQSLMSFSSLPSNSSGIFSGRSLLDTNSLFGAADEGKPRPNKANASDMALSASLGLDMPSSFTLSTFSGSISSSNAPSAPVGADSNTSAHGLGLLSFSGSLNGGGFGSITPAPAPLFSNAPPPAPSSIGGSPTKPTEFPLRSSTGVDLSTPVDVWMRSVFAGFDFTLINGFCDKFRREAGFATVADLLEAHARGQLTLEFVGQLAGFKLGHFNRLHKALENLSKSLSNY